MSPRETCELLRRSIPPLAHAQAGVLAELCGGWPLLAAVVGSNVGQDIAAGAPPSRAVADASTALRAHGPQAFDIRDTADRHQAIGHAVVASLDSLDSQVAIPGGSSLRERYVSLAIFPAATPVPLGVLEHWWQAAYGWSASAVRHFCRALADRSLVSAYLADRDAVMLHDVFRFYLRHLIGDDWAVLHQSLLDTYRPGRWSDLDASDTHMWRHLTYHLAEAGLDGELLDILADPSFVVQKVSRLGHQSLAADRLALDALPTDGSRPDDRSRARALADAGYLLHGLTAESDIATTLEVALRRAGVPSAIDRTRDPIHVEWVHDGPDRVEGHVGAVVGVATHGKKVASCGEDGTVRLWDLATRRPERTFRGHVGWVFATAFSADGATVASAGEDSLIRLWRTEGGEPVGVLAAHAGRIRSLAFSRAGHALVSGGEDGRVLVWDTGRLALLRSMQTPGCPVWSVSVGCGDAVVAASGEDEFVRLYDLATGQLLAESAAHRDWVRAVSFAARVPLLASGSGDGTMRVWNTADRALTPVGRMHALPDRVRAVAASDHAELIVAATEDATVHAFTADGPAGVAKAPAGVDWIRTLAISEDGAVVAGCEDGGVRLWATDGDKLGLLGPGANTVWSAQFAGGGDLAALGHGNGLVEIYDAATGDRRRRLQAQPGRVWSLAASNGRIAAACGDGTVLVWQDSDDTPQLRLNTDAHRTWATAMAGDLVAASTADGTVRLWNAGSGKRLWERHAHGGRVRSLAFDEAGQLLAACGGDGVVRLWHTPTGDPVTSFTYSGEWARAVALDPSGRRLVIGSGTGDIHVGDTTTGQLTAQLSGHTSRALMVAFTREHDLLVSAAADGTVRAWSLRHQRQVAQVRVDATLHCAAFDRRTSRLLVGSAAGAAMMTLCTATDG